MQDFIGIRVADSAEQMRIGQRALERVILANELGRKGFEIGAQDLHPAGIESLQAFLASNEVK